MTATCSLLFRQLFEQRQKIQSPGAHKGEIKMLERYVGDRIMYCVEIYQGTEIIKKLCSSVFCVCKTCHCHEHFQAKVRGGWLSMKEREEIDDFIPSLQHLFLHMAKQWLSSIVQIWFERKKFYFEFCFYVNVQ
jgi:hypothetical protein